MTPHERLFNYACNSSTKDSLHSGLCNLGPVLLKHHIQVNKTNPLVEEVEFIQTNPHYAHFKYQNHKESTLSTRH